MTISRLPSPRRRLLDLGVVVAGCLGASVLFIADGNATLGLLGVVLVLFVPGYLVTTWLAGGELAGVETLTLAISLSLAITVLIATALATTAPGLTPRSFAGALLVLLVTTGIGIICGRPARPSRTDASRGTTLARCGGPDGGHCVDRGCGRDLGRNGDGHGDAARPPVVPGARHRLRPHPHDRRDEPGPRAAPVRRYVDASLWRHKLGVPGVARLLPGRGRRLARPAARCQRWAGQPLGPPTSRSRVKVQTPNRSCDRYDSGSHEPRGPVDQHCVCDRFHIPLSWAARIDRSKDWLVRWPIGATERRW